MKLRLVRRLCFIMICTIVMLYIMMQYYAEPKEKNLLTLQHLVKDFREMPKDSISMDWLTNVPIPNKRPMNNKRNPSTKRASTVKSAVTSDRNKQTKVETFKAPACQITNNHSLYARNVTYQMNEIYNQLAFDDQPGGAWTQGFPITYNMDQWKDKPLEVFIVPFSHQDPGWRKTLENYFSTETKPNLDATLIALSEHVDAKFVYSEVSFLNLWLNTLSEEKKQIFKRLLSNGQWEIVSGGWVMPDEAVTHYYSIIDQFIEGHHWLLEHFDYRPNTTWSIDPFGQSSTMAYLSKKFGFSNMIINRVHYEVKKYLAKRKALEFFWYQTWDSKGSFGLLAHMFPFFSYDVPHTCGPEPAICCQFDFLRMEKYGCPWHTLPVLIDDTNVAARAEILTDQYRKKATLFNNNGLVLIPLGDDFRYQSTHEWNLQLDNYNKLIQHINSNSRYRMKIRYATLSDYFKVLTDRMNEAHSTMATSFPSLSDYWSGYYNSRPYQKSLSRILEAESRTAEILYSYARQSVGRIQNVAQLIPLISNLYQNLTTVRRNLGLFQHHDAITGTSKPEVMIDFSNKLLKAVEAARKVITLSSVYLLSFKLNGGDISNRLPVSNEFKQRLIQLSEEYDRNQNHDVTTSQSFYSLEDHLHNHEFPQPVLIDFSENNGVPQKSRRIYIFNPSTRNRSTIINLRVKGHFENFQAKQIFSDPLKPFNQLIIQLEHTVTKFPNDNQKQQPISLLYLSSVKLYPLSFGCIELILSSRSSLSLPLIPVKSQLAPNSVTEELVKSSRPLTIENSYIQLEFHPKTGYLQKMFNKLTQQSIDMKIDFITYKAPKHNSNSGAYLFISDGLGETLPQTKSYSYTKGDLVDTVTAYTEYVTHTVRLYKSSDLQSQFVEIENIVNIKVNHPTDIDLFMSVQTDLMNQDRIFYTDSNCFQFIQRQYYDKIPLQGNIYPIACGAYIEQQNSDNPKEVKRLNIFTTHSTGVVSPRVGQLNIWLDRRASKDDSRGIASNLQGEWIVQSRLHLFAETVLLDKNIQKVNPSLTIFAQQILNDLTQSVHKFLVHNSKLNNLLVPEYNLIPTSGLPCDYELVTMKTFHNPKIPSAFHAAPNTQIGVIIRRYSSVCYANYLPKIDLYSQCFNPVVQNKLDIKNLFGSIQLSYGLHTNLTMIPLPVRSDSGNDDSNKHLVKKLSHIHVNPMELEAFYLV
ncbi:unnamed protein product [Heterobilharzia americana]|nr:unnamed protein product [Heterobilharzia americana]